MKIAKFECIENKGAIERMAMLRTIVESLMPSGEFVQNARLADCLDANSLKSLSREAWNLRVDMLVYSSNLGCQVMAVFMDETRISKACFDNMGFVLNSHGIPLLTVGHHPAYSMFYGESDSDIPRGMSRCPNCGDGLFYVVPDDLKECHEGVRVICPRTLGPRSDSSAYCIDLDHPLNEYWTYVDAVNREHVRSAIVGPALRKLASGNSTLHVKVGAT
jgi:hypothetical protein